MSDSPKNNPPHERAESERLEAWHKYGKYPYLLAKFAFFGAIFVLLFFCLRTVESVAFPLFLSMMIAYLLDPLIDRFEARGIDRTVAILIVIAMMGLACVLMLLFLYPLVARQVVNVAQKFPTLLDTLQTRTLPWAQAQFDFEVPASLSAAAAEYGEELKSAAPTVFKKIGDWGTGLLTQTGVIVASLLNIVMIPIFTFYFLRDFDRMRGGAAQFIPAYRKDVIVDRLHKIDDVVGAWFRGQIQVSLILAAFYGIGLGLAFQFTGHEAFDGFALGVISGLMNVIPYVGFAVGFVLSVLVVLIEWTGWSSLIGVLIVFAVVQGLEGYVITPKVVGEKVGLSPVVVIIVLLLGGELSGLLGVLLAIPVAGAVKVLLPDLIALYRRSAYFTGHDPEALEIMAHGSNHSSAGEDKEREDEDPPEEVEEVIEPATPQVEDERSAEDAPASEEVVEAAVASDEPAGESSADSEELEQEEGGREEE